MCCWGCCDVVMVGGMAVTAGGWEEAIGGSSWKPLPPGKSSKASRSRGRSRSAGVMTPEAIPLWGVL